MLRGDLYVEKWSKEKMRIELATRLRGRIGMRKSPSSQTHPDSLSRPESRGVVNRERRRRRHFAMSPSKGVQRRTRNFTDYNRNARLLWSLGNCM